jgi:hypothetical protein
MSDEQLQLNDLGTFPRDLRVTIPGAIESSGNSSRILGGRVELEEIGPSTLKVIFFEEEGPDGQAEPREKFLETRKAAFAAGRLKPEQFEKQGSDVLSVSITSYERNYELKDILSILGVLFGSGFLIQLAGRWLARRKPAAPADPA